MAIHSSVENYNKPRKKPPWQGPRILWSVIIISRFKLETHSHHSSGSNLGKHRLVLMWLVIRIKKEPRRNTTNYGRLVVMFYKKLMNKHIIRFVFAFNKANYETHSQIFTQTRLKRMRLSFKKRTLQMWNKGSTDIILGSDVHSHVCHLKSPKLS